LDVLREETAKSFGFHDLMTRQLLPCLSILKREYSQFCKQQLKISYQQELEEGILREAGKENRCYKILKLLIKVVQKQTTFSWETGESPLQNY
jgi:hypothetical protein